MESAQTQRTEPGGTVPVPLEGMEAAVARIYADLLAISPIDRDTDFFRAGGDSMLAVELHLRLEQLAGRSLDLGAVLQDATVAGVARVIAAGAGRCGVDAAAEPESPLVVLQAGGSKPPVFLVHGRLGQAFVSPEFGRIVGEDQPLYGFRARGLSGNSRLYRTVPRMAAAYIEAMREVQPHGPYRLGGLCAGSVVALEMVRQLHDCGERTTPVLLMGPSLLAPMPRSLRWYIRRHVCLWSLRLPVVWRLPGTVGAETLARMRNREAQGAGQTDLGNVRIVKAGIRVTLALELALARYGAPSCSSPVLIITSRDRPSVTGVPGATGWRRRLTGKVRIFDVGENHSEMFHLRNAAFADAVRTCFDLMT